MVRLPYSHCIPSPTTKSDRNDGTTESLGARADCENSVFFKYSSGYTLRFIYVRNHVSERFILFAGIDDVVLDSVAAVSQAWISVTYNVVREAGVMRVRLAVSGRTPTEV
ncbi:hypothetical protein GOY11_33620, partial [Pseudomonas aeruginosa]|nr:hypothetical protein [Pseudomonas aeruginosa]